MSKIKKLYLAHPYDSQVEIRAWELKVEEKFDLELVNPFYDVTRDDVGANRVGKERPYAEDPEVIITRDLDLIKGAQGIVAIVDGSFSIGTIMEIVYSYKVYGKQTYIIVTNGHEKHYWLQFHSDKIFTSLEDFETFLEETSKER